MEPRERLHGSRPSKRLSPCTCYGLTADNRRRLKPRRVRACPPPRQEAVTRPAGRNRWSWLRQAVQLASDFACAQLEVLPAPSAMDISASKPIVKATVVIVPPDA